MTGIGQNSCDTVMYILNFHMTEPPGNIQIQGIAKYKQYLFILQLFGKDCLYPQGFSP